MLIVRLSHRSLVNSFRLSIPRYNWYSSMAATSTSFVKPERKTVLGLNFNMSADTIQNHTESIIQEYNANMSEIVAKGSVSFDSFKLFAEAEARAIIQSSQATVPALTSTDAAARQASSASKARLRETFQNIFVKEDLFDLLHQSYQSVINDQGSKLADQDVRYMEKILNSFADSGLGPRLKNGNVAKYTELNNHCCVAANTYEQRINENTDSVFLTREELAGCSESFIDSLYYDEARNKYEISMKAPLYTPVMQHAKLAETRKKVKNVANSRCMNDNEPLLREILRLRMTKAKVLGFESHSDFILKQKMVKTQDNARAFLLDIFESLKPRLLDDLKLLLNQKQCDVREVDDNEAIKLNSWDIPYYSRICKEEKFKIDSERIREYFPLEHVQSAIFNIYEEFLSVRFIKIPTEINNAWHESVEMYEVIDCDTNNVYGHFYLDLFSRDGKFGHQCVVPIVPSCSFQGDKILPAVSILGNMTRPCKDRPSLLRFAEVHTFFHEFGHVMHAVLSKTKYTRFSWTWPMMPWLGGVEQDFLEVPSMFLEKLVYEKWCIERLSSHYKTGAALDDESIKNLRDAQHFLSGLKWCRFIGMALYDLEIHSQDHEVEVGTETETIYKMAYGGMNGSFNLRNLWYEIMSKIAFQGGKYEIDDTFMPASWYHLVIGYDAGDYGYLYSEVYAYEILQEVTKSQERDGFEGLKSIGKHYRSTILEPCASMDGIDMLTNFLNRKPGNSAFIDALDLKRQ